MSGIKENIVKNLASYIKDLENYFEFFNYNIDNHTTWLIRQRLKKTRAIIRLLRKEITISSKDSTNFKIVYDALGAYRDSCQKKELLADFFLKNKIPFTKIEKIIDIEIEINKTALLNVLETGAPQLLVNFIKEYRKKVKELPATKCKNIELDFVNQRFKKIHSLLNEKNIDSERLHRIRILLKQIINITKICVDKESLKKQKFNLKKLEVADKVLGKWHDLNVLYEFAKRIKDKEPKEENAMFFSKIEIAESKSFKAALKTIQSI